MFGAGAVRLAMESDEQLQVIVLNTPKCATGSLQKMFLDVMPCEEQHKEIEAGHVMKSCPGTDSFVYRSHEVESTVQYFEARPQLKLGKSGRCVVVSAFRNPSSWLKSVFFEEHKEALCNGVDSVSQVLEDFEDWIVNRLDPSAFKADGVAALFGFNDFSVVTKMTAHAGGFFRLPANSFSLGPFAPCDLIFLQTEELDHSHDRFLAEFSEIEPVTHQTMEDLCPNSKKVREAIAAHKISEASRTRLFSMSTTLEQLWRFYGGFG